MGLFAARHPRARLRLFVRYHHAPARPRRGRPQSRQPARRDQRPRRHRGSLCSFALPRKRWRPGNGVPDRSRFGRRRGSQVQHHRPRHDRRRISRNPRPVRAPGHDRDQYHERQLRLFDLPVERRTRGDLGHALALGKIRSGVFPLFHRSSRRPRRRPRQEQPRVHARSLQLRQGQCRAMVRGAGQAGIRTRRPRRQRRLPVQPRAGAGRPRRTPGGNRLYRYRGGRNRKSERPRRWS